MSRPYRPSNGTEGERFEERFCERCVNLAAMPDGCNIQGAAFLFGIDEEGYPPEWQYGDDGKPTCTAFELDVTAKPSGPLIITNADGEVVTPEQAAFEMLAFAHPIEAHDAYPDEFWTFFQKKRPGVSREQMVALLKQVEAEGEP